jgi:sugar fermentation stimulation protein A
MIFTTEMIPATLVKRYKRFLVDVVLDGGEGITAYCPNTGSMRSCSESGSKVYLSRSSSTTRKYPFTLEMVRSGDVWVGVNTGLTNTLVVEAIRNGDIAEMQNAENIQTEVSVSPGTRLDAMVETSAGKIFIEIKNCTLVEGDVAMFPDAVTARGTKHLRSLAELCSQGHGGVIFYLVQRTDALRFKPAAHIDPLYAKVLEEVTAAGVQVLVYQADVSPRGIHVVGSLPFSQY